MPADRQPTAARPPVNPVPYYVVVLTLEGGRTRRSIPLSRLEDAETVGRCSLLDKGVLAYRVERREGVVS